MNYRKILRYALHYPEYPGILLEKSMKTGKKRYLLAKNLLPLAEGTALGSLAYWVGDSIDYGNTLFVSNLFTMTARHFQTRYYMVRNWERLRRGDFRDDI